MNAEQNNEGQEQSGSTTSSSSGTAATVNKKGGQVESKDENNQVLSDKLPICEALEKLFPDESKKWEKWAGKLTDEDLDTVGHVRRLSAKAWVDLALSAVLKDGLRKLRPEETQDASDTSAGSTADVTCLQSLGFSVEATLGSGVYRVVGPDGRIVAKLAAKPNLQDIDPNYPLDSQFGMLENEASLLLGRLAKCGGVVTATVKRTPSHLVILEPLHLPLVDCPLPPDPADKRALLVRWGLQAVSTLKQIHAAGVMHRDIKPENIVLSPDNSVLIIDFGLSILSKDRLSETTLKLRVGTPAYGSNNYEHSQPLCPRDDLEGLCFAFHALNVGRMNWLLQVNEGKKPTIAELYTSDPVVHEIVDAWNREGTTQRTTARQYLKVGGFVVAAGLVSAAIHIMKF